jgi:hypothetical protein
MDGSAAGTITRVMGIAPKGRLNQGPASRTKSLLCRLAPKTRLEPKLRAQKRAGAATPRPFAEGASWLVY